jgi:hypothetical protein
VRSSGLELTGITNYHVSGPRITGCTYEGVATKPRA